MFIAIALVLAALMVFYLDVPGRGGTGDGMLYFVLGLVPLQFPAWIIPLGIPTALMLAASKVTSKKQKIVFVLAGALVGWLFFTYFRPVGFG